MGWQQAIWHVLNFLAPAAGLGLLAALLSKLLWFRGLRQVAVWRLWLWTAAPGASALVLGLLMLGRDGRMGTYALLVVFSAFGLWWGGLRRLP